MAIIDAYILQDNQQLQDMLNVVGGPYPGRCPLDGFPFWTQDEQDANMLWRVDSCPVDTVLIGFKSYIRSLDSALVPQTGNEPTSTARLSRIRRVLFDNALSWLEDPTNCPLPEVKSYIFAMKSNGVLGFIFDAMIEQQVINIIANPMVVHLEKPADNTNATFGGTDDHA